MNTTTMESLALPQDLYWDVKLEPNSPPTIQLFSIFEELGGNMLDDEDIFANDIPIICSEELDLKHDDMDFTQELIGEELVVELYDLKEENFYTPSPLLDNTLESVVTNPTQVIKVQSPNDINHFGFPNNHGASVFTSLTPPSSPPQIVASPVPSQALELSASITTAVTNLPIAEQINGVLQNVTAPSEPTTTPVQSQFVFNNNWHNHHSTTDTATSNIVASSPNSSSSSNYDIVLNTQIIDDILKTAANEFFEESESQSSVSTPSTADYSSTDDEWMPSSGSCSPTQIVSNESLLADVTVNTITKKRTRPYGRGVEDRKKRKKEQNKNAATRYRQKKKLEMEIIQIEEHELSQRHEELKHQLAEHKREAKYLKRLLREFYAKKQS